MKKIIHFLLIVLVVFQGVSGVVGGIGLIADPSGKNLEIPIDWLAGSPFSNYLIPGIILLTILGMYPIIIFMGLLKRKYWAFVSTKLIGFVLIIWIATEIIIIGYHAEPPLQLIYGLLGLVIILLVYITNVKSYYLQ